MQPTAIDRTRIAVRAVVCVRTVDRIYSGAPALSTTRRRIEQAAIDLGLPPPPAPGAPSMEGA